MNKTLLLFTAIFFTLSNLASASIIASTDFDNRTVSGATASNLNWTFNGITSPGSLTVSSPAVLFDTTDAEDRFAVNRNLHDEGSWTFDISLNVLSGNDIKLGMTSLDAFIFNNSGELQPVQRDLDLKFSLLDSTFASLSEISVSDIYADDGVISQPQSVSFDFSGKTLSSGDTYYFRLTASGEGPGNNAGIDNLTINGDLVPSPVPEPSTFLLLGSGLAGLGFYARRRKKA